MPLEPPNAKNAKEMRRTRSESADFEADCSREIIGAAIEVQRVLGLGLLESAYAAAFSIELRDRQLAFEREVPIVAKYKGQDVGVGFRADFIVERSVIVELKASAGDAQVHRAQLASYLKLAGLEVGLLTNFHHLPLSRGIQRVVNKL